MKLKPGDKMPDLTVMTAYGGKTTINMLLAKPPKTVFWVIRYVGCPVCRYDIHMLAERYEEFRRENAQVIVVLQSEAALLREALTGSPLPFDLICDPTMDFYKALDIGTAADSDELVGAGRAESYHRFQEKARAAADAGFEHGEFEGNELQLPAVFVADEKGSLLYVHYGADITDQPGIDVLIGML
jgi:peroxiredoxin